MDQKIRRISDTGHRKAGSINSALRVAILLVLGIVIALLTKGIFDYQQSKMLYSNFSEACVFHSVNCRIVSQPSGISDFLKSQEFEFESYYHFRKVTGLEFWACDREYNNFFPVISEAVSSWDIAHVKFAGCMPSKELMAQIHLEYPELKLIGPEDEIINIK